MRHFTNQPAKLGFLLICAALVIIIGSGFLVPLSASNQETYQGLKVFSEVIEQIQQHYVDPVDTKDIIQKGIQGMMQSLDPHSAFLLPEDYQDLQFDTQGEFGGIGIVISKNKGVLTVIAPIEGTPAYNAGIKTGDVIYQVDGQATRDMTLIDAVKLMRGPKGTKVTISVVRKNIPKPIDFTLTRDAIPLESVRSIVLQPGYGYIWVTNFRENTTADLEKALKQFDKGDVPLKGLILDLRDNPGGLLSQAVDVADLFIDDGIIVSIKGREGRHTSFYKANARKTQRKYPIVVLINGGSASASEIVAGALQDHKRALVLGTTSFGKGSVQTVKPLREGYGLKFTIARYYTPSGRSIQAQGIEPDIVVRHQILTETANDQEAENLKEVDLINHLGPEIEAPEQSKPDAEAEPEAASPGETETDESLPELEGRHGRLKIETLMTDSQVKRALDILISYEILRGLKP
jgi:carboxyl-terminal processing protease